MNNSTATLELTDAEKGLMVRYGGAAMAKGNRAIIERDGIFYTAKNGVLGGVIVTTLTPTHTLVATLRDWRFVSGQKVVRGA